MKKKRRKTDDAVEILHRRYVEGKPEAAIELQKVRDEAAIARRIYALRTKAHLTQWELARMVGTTATVIGRLEDADHEGHSVDLLNRIGDALDQRVQIRFVPRGRAEPPSPHA